MAQRKVFLRENEQVQARGRAMWLGSEPVREAPARSGTSQGLNLDSIGATSSLCSRNHQVSCPRVQT